MKRYVDEDEAYHVEEGQRLDTVLAKLRHLEQEHKRVIETREMLRHEAEKLLEALHQEINKGSKGREA